MWLDFESKRTQPHQVFWNPETLMHSLGKQGESTPAAASWDVTEMPCELQMNRLLLRMRRRGFPSPQADGIPISRLPGDHWRLTGRGAAGITAPHLAWCSHAANSSSQPATPGGSRHIIIPTVQRGKPRPQEVRDCPHWSQKPFVAVELRSQMPPSENNIPLEGCRLLQREEWETRKLNPRGPCERGTEVRWTSQEANAMTSGPTDHLCVHS